MIVQISVQEEEIAARIEEFGKFLGEGGMDDDAAAAPTATSAEVVCLLTCYVFNLSQYLYSHAALPQRENPRQKRFALLNEGS